MFVCRALSNDAWSSRMDRLKGGDAPANVRRNLEFHPSEIVLRIRRLDFDFHRRGSIVQVLSKIKPCDVAHMPIAFGNRVLLLEDSAWLGFPRLTHMPQITPLRFLGRTSARRGIRPLISCESIVGNSVTSTKPAVPL